MEFSKICVLGLGYIGLPTASTFATHGVKVLGVDVADHVLETLRNGEIHIHEPGLRSVVQDAIDSGNLTISEQPDHADAFMICVPTPFTDEKKADMRYVVSAAESIVPHLQKGNLVVLESTSPPRTTVDLVAPILEKSGLKAGADFFLVYSPERVLPGQILRELIENARVIGGVDQASAQVGHDLYSIFVKGEIILTDATTAEMVKLMENTSRDIDIAVANEFARLADRVGIDIWEAIRLANLHPRIDILRPGPGVGGHCLGVDPWFLVEAAPDLTPLIRTAREVNDAQPGFVVDLVGRALNDGRDDGETAFKGRKIAALGLAYKADVDDLRESPAIEICRRLSSLGADVRAHDPYKPNPNLEGLVSETALDDVLASAELLLLLVPHAQFKALSPEKVADKTPARIIVDAVDGWDASLWKAAGFRVYRLGVGFRP